VPCALKRIGYEVVAFDVEPELYLRIAERLSGEEPEVSLAGVWVQELNGGPWRTS